MAKVVSFTGTASSFRIVGAAATTHNLFTIENASGSAVIVGVRRIIVQMDATAVLTVVMPLIKASRPSALPTGGTILSKNTMDVSTAGSSDSVVIRGANAYNAGAATAITATAGTILWQQYAMRMHTVIGKVLADDNPLLPTLIENTSFVLRANEALLVQIVAAATTSNPSTNHWWVQCVWEEYTVV
jgi:hypothetical protein